MLKETIYDRIGLMEEYATKQEKVIIEFIRTNPIREMIMYSITEFSEKVGVSDATMLRFCRKLGLKGYSEFRFLLSQSEDAAENDAEDEADRILDSMVTVLRSTHDLLDHAQIEKAARLILEARCVYAFGSGNSGVAAQEFCNKVLRYGLHCSYQADSHFQIIAASLLSEQDVLVLFSVSGGTKDMLSLAKNAARSGVKLVIVTNYLKSPLAKYATALLYVVGKSTPLNSGSLVSKVSQLYIVDVLGRELQRQMGSRAEENLRKTAIAVMDREI
ncbi:MAG: MurR/RpiR family transcriptional regulator [Oscillospiraceae bacterium]|nr:MurR/RpiR family transcriptional regulator [Oscillospiraceae bacterium]